MTQERKGFVGMNTLSADTAPPGRVLGVLEITRMFVFRHSDANGRVRGDVAYQTSDGQLYVDRRGLGADFEKNLAEVSPALGGQLRAMIPASDAVVQAALATKAEVDV